MKYAFLLFVLFYIAGCVANPNLHHPTTAPILTPQQIRDAQVVKMLNTLGWIQILAVISIPVISFVAIRTMNIGTGVAGIGAAISILMLSYFIGEIIGHMREIVWWIIGLSVLWLVVEALIKKSLWKAIRTSPVQDIDDLLKRYR